MATGWRRGDDPKTRLSHTSDKDNPNKAADTVKECCHKKCNRSSRSASPPQSSLHATESQCLSTYPECLARQCQKQRSSSGDCEMYWKKPSLAGHSFSSAGSAAGISLESGQFSSFNSVSSFGSAMASDRPSASYGSTVSDTSIDSAYTSGSVSLRLEIDTFEMMGTVSVSKMSSYAACEVQLANKKCQMLEQCQLLDVYNDDDFDLVDVTDLDEDHVIRFGTNDKWLDTGIIMDRNIKIKCNKSKKNPL